MSELKMFIPITKVDAAQRLVYGIATAEIEDRSGEICDYDSTKPNYEKWSDEIAKSTGGKSLGNVRAMHGAVAAGKITALNFNDARKQIEVCAKIVDDAEWMKVSEGVYTGFSQGGSYVRRWTDDTGLQRYTAQPAEISLVDLPCLPQARFEMVKADGSREWREFGQKLDKGFGLVAQLSMIVEQLDELQTRVRMKLAQENMQSDLPDELEDVRGRAVAILQTLMQHETAASTDAAPCLPAHSDSAQAKRLAAAHFAKIGARNNADDQSRIQAMHDTSVELGATCEAQKHASGGLEKRFDAISTKLDDLLQRVKNIESQPLPLPLAGRTRAVAKSEDGGGFDAEHEDEPAPTDRDALALLAIKKAQSMGRSYFTR